MIVGPGRIGAAVAAPRGGLRDAHDHRRARRRPPRRARPGRRRLAARAADARDATPHRRRRARDAEPARDPRQHRARRSRRPGRPRGGAARGPARRAPRSTSPTPSRCRRPTRCSPPPTCSSSRTSARPPTARASAWPTSPSTTCSPRSRAGRCPTPRHRRPPENAGARRRGPGRPLRLPACASPSSTSGRTRRACCSPTCSAQGAVEELERRTTVTRLGQGVERQRRARRRGDGRACSRRSTSTAEPIDALGGADRSIAVLTSAVRDAANGQAFTARVRDEYGLDARTILGAEEARLTFLGATSERDADGSETVVVVDIGGGSTELVDRPRAHRRALRVHAGGRRAPQRAPHHQRSAGARRAAGARRRRPRDLQGGGARGRRASA